LIEPPRTVVQATGQSRGSERAPITIVEFSDFECNFCGRATATLKRVETAYADKVRVVFRDYPLPIHRGAPRAAEAAQCAGDQGKFWEMHDRLFSKGGPLSDADLRNYAGEVALDMQQFSKCLQSGKHTVTWKSSQDEGVRLGVASTPTFFINGRMVTGAMPYETFARIIDEELDRAGPEVQPLTGVTRR
jgi:protein-disulfide isomerase